MSADFFSMSRSFREEILYLISLRQEGGYWDFKRQWYDNHSDLLHDIICMANNLCNRTAYIIIGVDEENGFSVSDVSKDANRKNTQGIVDFLKDKKFAGGIRPVVHVEELRYGEGVLDILVIDNSHNTPFYLSDQYQGVKANYIYTRVMDTNTPINQSADINIVEYLWKKRFHLDCTPLEQMGYFLKYPDKWENSPIEFDFCKYYKPAPEYVLREEPDEHRTAYEFYLFGQMNNHPSWYTVTLYYHQTPLEQFIGEALDGGRCFVISPSRSGVSFGGHHSWDAAFSYYTANSLKYTLVQFYRSRGSSDYEYSYRRFMECVLVFGSDREREQFEEYIIRNEETYRDLYHKQGDEGLPVFPNLEGYNMEEFKKDYRNALVLKKLLKAFRQRN